MCYYLVPLLLLSIPSSIADCPTYLPYTNMRYMTQAELTQFNLTDPCSTTCKPTYFGEFCQNNQINLPKGPWNSPGYYTANQPLLRTVNVNTNDISQLQFLSPGILVGIRNIHSSTSDLVQISLFSKYTTTLYTAKIGAV